MLGLALGLCRMSLDDFMRLRPIELAEVLKAHSEKSEAADRSAWERLRTLAVVTAQPHTRKPLKPKTFLPLPWDKKNETNTLSRAEAYARYQKLTAKQRK